MIIIYNTYYSCDEYVIRRVRPPLDYGNIKLPCNASVWIVPGTAGHD